jgi:hypothetical protein
MQTLSSFKGNSEGVAKSWQTRRQNQQPQENKREVGDKVWGGTKGLIGGALAGGALGLTAGGILNRKYIQQAIRLNKRGANKNLVKLAQKNLWGKESAEEVANRVRERFDRKYGHKYLNSIGTAMKVGALGGAGYGAYKGVRGKGNES